MNIVHGPRFNAPRYLNNKRLFGWSRDFHHFKTRQTGTIYQSRGTNYQSPGQIRTNKPKQTPALAIQI